MDIYSAALEGNEYIIDGALDYCDFAMEGANIDFTKRYRAIVKEVKSKYKEAKQLAKEGYPNKVVSKITEINTLIDESIEMLRKDFADQSAASVALANGILILKSLLICFLSFAGFIGAFKGANMLQQLAIKVEEGKVQEVFNLTKNATLAATQLETGQNTVNAISYYLSKATPVAMVAAGAPGVGEITKWVAFLCDYFFIPKKRRTMVDANKYQMNLIKNLQLMKSHYYNLQRFLLVPRAQRVRSRINNKEAAKAAKEAAKANNLQGATEALIKLIFDEEGDAAQ